MAYTNIDDPSAYFQATIYTGNGDSADDTNAITNDGNSDLKPDFLWIKRRDYDNGHQLADSTRGVTKFLGSETTAAEYTQAGRLASFNTDGFTVQSSSGAFNAENEPFVAWQWKANGGTTASNSDGSITSTVQANQDAGFSIITYTGNATNSTVGHGLGVAPQVIFNKKRGATGSWSVWHKEACAGTQLLELNTNGATVTVAAIWNSTVPTSSVFSIGTDGQTNSNNTTYITYAFAEKQGYSKFGKYVGNGSSDGSFAYTGFKPEFVLVKKVTGTGDWIITDNARGINAANPRLYADLADAEGSAADYIDHLSNGFKIRTSAGSMNTSGGTYIYMAFAENPFTTSTGVPTTAR